MSAPELVAGTIVGGKFTIRRERARTELTATYEAITAPSRGVELKLLAPSLRQRPDLEECLKHTMRVTNELPSSLALQVLDVGIDHDTGAPFLATEQSMNPSLAELVQLCPLGLDELIGFARNLGAALDAAHARGLAHLALSANNVFVGPSPRFEVRLVDFGASLLLGKDGSDERWAAPELGTNPQLACDVFSAGLLTLFAATGATLADRSEASLRAPATSLARATGTAVDARFDAPLARALAIDPAQRYRSVSELAEALAQAFARAPVETAQLAPPVVPSPLAPSPPEAVEPLVAAFVPPPPEAMAAFVPPPPEAMAAFVPPPPEAMAAFAAPPPGPPAFHAPPQEPFVADAAATHREMAYDAPRAPGPIAVGSADSTSYVPPAPPKQGRLVLIGGAVVVAVGLVAGVGWALSKRADGRVAAAASASASSGSSGPVASVTPAASAPPVAAVTPAAGPSAVVVEAPPAVPAPAVPAPAGNPADAPTSTAKLNVVCTPECDSITIDDNVVASFPAGLAPGEHTVTVRRGAHPPQTKRVVLAATKTETVSFVFMAQRPPPKKPCGKFLQRCD